MNIVAGVRQVLASPVDASYKVIAQWHERKEWQMALEGDIERFRQLWIAANE